MNPERLLPRLSFFQKYRFGILLIALLGMLVHEPLARLCVPRINPLTARIVFSVVFGWLMISAVYAVSDRPRTAVIAILLCVAALVTECIEFDFLAGSRLLIGHLLTSVFLMYVIVVMLRHVFSRDRVDSNTVFAALCVYLLLGVLWALVYAMLEFVEIGSFSYSLAAGESVRFTASHTSLSIYFSFMTMTTVGYGDVVPVSPIARALATLQAVVGQFYLTVLVAWLVGLHIAHSRQERDHPRDG